MTINNITRRNNPLRRRSISPPLRIIRIQLLAIPLLNIGHLTTRYLISSIYQRKIQIHLSYVFSFLHVQLYFYAVFFRLFCVVHGLLNVSSSKDFVG